MARHWMVQLKGGGPAWGPFDEQSIADDFAEYITREVDPAEVRPLQNPARDLLAWRRTIAAPRMAAVPVTPTFAASNGPGRHSPGCRRQDPHFFPAQCMSIEARAADA